MENTIDNLVNRNHELKDLKHELGKTGLEPEVVNQYVVETVAKYANMYSKDIDEGLNMMVQRLNCYNEQRQVYKR